MVGDWGRVFVSVALSLFVFTCILYNFYLGENSLQFLSRNRLVLIGYRALVLALVVWGSVQDLSTVFAFADITMTCLAFVNLMALALLFKVGLRVMRDYDVSAAPGSATGVRLRRSSPTSTWTAKPGPPASAPSPRRRRTPSRCRAAIAESRAGALPRSGACATCVPSSARPARKGPTQGLRMLPVKNLFVLYTGGTIGMLQTLGTGSGRWLRSAHARPPAKPRRRPGPALALRRTATAAGQRQHDPGQLAGDARRHRRRARRRPRRRAAPCTAPTPLAYSAAALSFLLLDLPIPVLLTGSMLPAGAPGSDAWDNLVGALRVLQEGHARGVQVYFNDALLHGARVSKLRSDAFDAFAELPRPRHAEHAEMPAALGYRQPRREVNLAVLPLYPGPRAAHLRGLLDSGVEALLLECYGSGTGPSDDEELLALLREAHARGVLLAAVSQCAYGQVEFGVYAAGSRLRDAGLLGWRNDPRGGPGQALRPARRRPRTRRSATLVRLDL